jgi:hypothetical protein
MDTRIYHGKLKIDEIANALVARFNRGNLAARQMVDGDKAIVQISTLQGAAPGGQTAIGVTLQQNKDGITAQLGQQAWLGIAASLGASAFSALRNPLSLLGRLDDIAQDIENLQLDEQIWDAIEDVAKAAGASHHLSENLRRLGCEYCGVANPVGASSCLACGAPLGDAQPITCGNCGFIAHRNDTKCPNCGKKL